MSYITNNEFDTFEFTQSTLLGLKLNGSQAVIEVADVIIKPENSANTDIRKMATNELTLELNEVSEIKVIKDGYIIRDMDGKVCENVDDSEVIDADYAEVIKAVIEQPVDNIVKKGEEYIIYTNTEASLTSYTVKITAKKDSETWERFRNLPEEYR